MKNDIGNKLKKLREKLDAKQISKADYFMWVRVYDSNEKSKEQFHKGGEITSKELVTVPRFVGRPQAFVSVGKRYPAPDPNKYRDEMVNKYREENQ